MSVFRLCSLRGLPLSPQPTTASASTRPRPSARPLNCLSVSCLCQLPLPLPLPLPLSLPLPCQLPLPLSTITLSLAPPPPTGSYESVYDTLETCDVKLDFSVRTGKALYRAYLLRISTAFIYPLARPHCRHPHWRLPSVIGVACGHVYTRPRHTLLQHPLKSLNAKRAKVEFCAFFFYNPLTSTTNYVTMQAITRNQW